MIACVYRIRNRRTGEVYVGSTIDLYKRMRSHLNRLKVGTHSNNHLQAAWNAAGRDGFSFGILERVAATNEALSEAEERWTNTLRPSVPGFYSRLPAWQGRRRPFRSVPLSSEG